MTDAKKSTPKKPTNKSNIDKNQRLAVGIALGLPVGLALGVGLQANEDKKK